MPIPPPLPDRVTASYRSKQKIMGYSSGNNFVCTAMPDMWDRLFDEGYKADILISTDGGNIIYAHASILVSIIGASIELVISSCKSLFLLWLNVLFIFT